MSDSLTPAAQVEAWNREHKEKGQPVEYNMRTTTLGPAFVEFISGKAKIFIAGNADGPVLLDKVKAID